MEKVAGKILKSDSVILEGQFRLDAAQTGLTPTKKKAAPSAAPRACIVENHSESCIIEITCPCGTKTYVRCEYANGQPGDEHPDPDNPKTVGGNDNENRQ